MTQHGVVSNRPERGELSSVVFVALMVEARPLIDQWRLRLMSNHHPFAIYQNGGRAVVITGIGRANMAAAVSYSMAILQVKQGVLLNVGIAGHPDYPLGSLWLAHKITDADSGKSSYPPMTFTGRSPSAALISFGQPQTTYELDALYDMEASAFYEIACKFTSPEWTHCLKIISDNQQQSINALCPNQVSEWITACLPAIDRLLKDLEQSRTKSVCFDDAIYNSLIEKWHFTASNAVKLQNLLQKWQLLKGESVELLVAEAKNGREVLLLLEQALENQRFSL